MTNQPPKPTWAALCSIANRDLVLARCESRARRWLEADYRSPLWLTFSFSLSSSALSLRVGRVRRDSRPGALPKGSTYIVVHKG